LTRLEIAPEEFFMIGNSLKSDVLPVLAIGGHAVHIPFHTTWEHEKIEHKVEHPNFKTLDSIVDVLPLLLK
jgi:putative hydrolase of the HAD superfamily